MTKATDFEKWRDTWEKLFIVLMYSALGKL